ncbi:MAG: HAMP domain-containing sensor histidine kinase [Gemmatimonadales bacterium]
MRRDSTSPRIGWPLLFLLAGLGCIGLALAEARRSERTNEAVARSALWGYSTFVIWSYREHLTEALRAMAREALGAVNHGDQLHLSMRIPNAPELGHYLPWDPACICHVTRAGPLPVAFLGFKLGTDTINVGRNRATSSDSGWIEDRQREQYIAPDSGYSAAERKWLVDTLSVVARSPRSPWGYQLIAMGGEGDRTRFIVSTLMPTARGDTMVYAAEYSGEMLATMLANVLDAPGLLPEALASKGSNREILSVQVRDTRDKPLFGWNVPAEWRIPAQAKLPLSYGQMVIQLQIRPELTDKLTIGGLPRSRLPLLLALLLLAAGLTVIAMVQLRREARFARDRTTFVANVSHELRTPLTQIRLVTDMLRLGRESDPVRREAALALVDREVTRLQHLVEGVLRFSRGERPDDHAPRELVDVAAEVRSVVAEFAPLAAPRGVHINVVAKGNAVAMLRAGALRQVLLNLLDNAVKYGPDGQTVLVAVQAMDGGGARVAVTDQGPGVVPDERDRIWQPFERGGEAVTRAAGGSGIGLTVVREIAEGHGGTARVGDPSGGGATFVVTFPGAHA